MEMHTEVCRCRCASELPCDDRRCEMRADIRGRSPRGVSIAGSNVLLTRREVQSDHKGGAPIGYV
jgi:hypothetical protein